MLSEEPNIGICLKKMTAILPKPRLSTMTSQSILTNGNWKCQQVANLPRKQRTKDETSYSQKLNAIMMSREKIAMLKQVRSRAAGRCRRRRRSGKERRFNTAKEEEEEVEVEEEEYLGQQQHVQMLCSGREEKTHQEQKLSLKRDLKR